MRKIAFVIKTDGLEYDDRLRKEIQSLRKLFPDILCKVFVMLPDNRKYEGVTSYGVPYKSIYISARDRYPSAQKTALKGYEFYRAVEEDLLQYDAVWAANVEASFIPLLSRNRRILWDLHELPLMYTRNFILRKLLRFTFNRCRVVLHANPQRVEYLEELGVVAQRSKHFSLRNYPSFDDVDSECDETFQRFKDWKGNRKCVYLQGLSEDRRSAYESVAAVLVQGDFVAVVIGKMCPYSLQRLKNDFGELLIKERILFIGKIPQLKIPLYVAECQMSMVFYKNVQPNNWYCEANRFYQSVVLGLPVVTGNNPSMKEIVDQYGFGVAIDDDGSSIIKIVEGMNQLINEYDKFHDNAINNRDKIKWDSQESVIQKIIMKLFE